MSLFLDSSFPLIKALNPYHTSQSPDFYAATEAKLLQSCLTLCDAMGCSPPGSSVRGENTGVGCHAPLQGIFPTQGSNPHLLRLLHW